MFQFQPQISRVCERHTAIGGEIRFLHLITTSGLEICDFFHSIESKNHSGYKIHQHLFKPHCSNCSSIGKCTYAIYLYTMNHTDAWFYKKYPPTKGLKTSTYLCFCLAQTLKSKLFLKGNLMVWFHVPKSVATCNILPSCAGPLFPSDWSRSHCPNALGCLICRSLEPKTTGQKFHTLKMEAGPGLVKQLIRSLSWFQVARQGVEGVSCCFGSQLDSLNSSCGF